MSDAEKIIKDLEAQAKAALAVEKLQSHLSQTADDKTQAAADMQKQAGLTNDPEEKQEFLDKAELLNKEAEFCKEKAADLGENPEPYQQQYKEEQAQEAKEQETKGQEEHTQEQTPDNDNVTEQGGEGNTPPTPGEQIEDVFGGEGLLDQAFAEMMGNIVDSATGHDRYATQEKEQEQDH